MTAFPTIKPSRRAVSLGDYPVKSFRSVNGSEVRIRYGNVRSEATLDLVYEKLTAAEADQFVNHYDANSVQGTFKTFSVGTALTVGWSSGSKVQGSAAWRYAGPPKFTQAGGDCDRMDVTVKLKTVS